ncbi:MAG: hypothetical protein ACPGU9_08930 [Flavobacteriaceae bacterium]
MKTLTTLLFLSALCIHAQKRIEKTIAINEQTSSVVFNLEHVFSISVKSSKTPVINIKAISEGEYANHFVVTEQTNDEALTIEGKIAFTFPDNQDKLSAHKVHAIAVEITVPETVEIIFNSDIGNLQAVGNYRGLTTNFLYGNCELTNVSGKMLIQTVNGDINLITKSGRVITETKTGLITQEQLLQGSSVFDLRTVNGHINIEQAK